MQIIQKQTQRQSLITKLYSILIVSIIGLYSVIIFIPIYLKVDSTPISTAYRFGYLCVSLFIIYKFIILRQKKNVLNLGVIFFILFWIIYSYRLINDLSFNTLIFYEGLTPSYFYLYAFGGTLLPCLALILSRGNFDYPKVGNYLFYCYAIGCFLTLFYYIQNIGLSAELFMQRVTLSNEATGKRPLSVLAVSINGGYLMALSLLNLLFSIKGSFKFNISFFTFGIGLACLLVGASRGPTATTIIALLIILVYHFKHSKINLSYYRKIVLAVVFFIFSGYYIISKVGFENLQIVGRFADMSNAEYVEERDDIREIAIDDFKENPILGKNFLIVYEGEGGFAHNIFIESLHATGIIGSLFFYGMYLVALIKSFIIFWHRTHLIYPLIIFLITLLFSVTSGSLYANPILWTTTVMILLTDTKVIKNNPL